MHAVRNSLQYRITTFPGRCSCLIFYHKLFSTDPTSGCSASVAMTESLLLHELMVRYTYDSQGITGTGTRRQGPCGELAGIRPAAHRQSIRKTSPAALLSSRVCVNDTWRVASVIRGHRDIRLHTYPEPPSHGWSLERSASRTYVVHVTSA